MQKKWMIKKGSKELILFFGGWGMDEHAISHLDGSRDVLMLYDYRDIATESSPVSDEYDSIIVVAWSMGVWAASVLLSEWKLPVTKAIAINGTERPIDERYGVPPKSYVLTEKRMDEKGRDYFFSRMFINKEDRNRFEENKPERSLEDQLEELKAIRVQSVDNQCEIEWNKVYISREDKIFPMVNQENWWHNRTSMYLLEGGHYPFYYFPDWDGLIAYENK